MTKVFAYGNTVLAKGNHQKAEHERRNTMRAKHSKVMTIANRLVTQGCNRANAMVKAWILVKMPLVESRGAGVTFGNRQKAVERLSKYSAEDITIRLVREQDNAVDKNAVAVYAEVRGRGSYCMGYLPKALAAFIAPLLDSRNPVAAFFREIRGMCQPYMNYGLRIEVRI